jgi:DNA-3-methyladenine glycosylase
MAVSSASGGLVGRESLAADTLTAARHLIGARLVMGSGPEARAGRIVEVEAYVGPDDLASHARFGRTKRNSVMFGPPGVAYVYLVYGMYHCLNVVTEVEGRPAALLIRALEPTAGLDEMRSARVRWARARSASRGSAAVERATRRVGALPSDRLASGPGLVCAALDVDSSVGGMDLCDTASELRLEVGLGDEPMIVATGPPVGIGYAPEPWRSRPWRFFVAGNASVSAAGLSAPPPQAEA